MSDKDLPTLIGPRFLLESFVLGVTGHGPDFIDCTISRRWTPWQQKELENKHLKELGSNVLQAKRFSQVLH